MFVDVQQTVQQVAAVERALTASLPEIFIRVHALL